MKSTRVWLILLVVDVLVVVASAVVLAFGAAKFPTLLVVAFWVLLVIGLSNVVTSSVQLRRARRFRAEQPPAS